MGDFLLDAVAQFLKGEQWLEPVQNFMRTHKLAFVGLSGPQESYSLQHHAIFVEFKEMAERLLEGIIQDLGCSPTDFVSALESAVQTEAGGPKEEEVQLLVKTLLSYGDFHAFCEWMQNYVDWNVVPTLPAEESDASVPADSSTFDPKTYFASHEWLLQEVVARSLLDAQTTGQLSEEDAAYIPWANAIMEMKAYYTEKPVEQEVEVAAEASASSNPVETKMKELQTNLIRERLKVDLLVAQRLSERNAVMRLQMDALCKHAGTASATEVSGGAMTAEAELSMLCERVEAIQTELKAVKKRCFAFKSVTAQHIDEIYLFLKEKIHFKHDLAECENEIAEFVFSRISSQDSGLVPEMLQWLLLESEAQEIQHEIQTRSFCSPRAEAKDDNVHDRWIQHWSDEQGAYYYVNAVTGASQWEPPMSKDGEPILGYWGDDGQWVPFTFLEPAPTDAAADAKDATESLPPLNTAASATWTPPSEIKEIGSALESALALKFDTMSMLDVEASLQKVLKEHEDESKKLEIALQVEHARQTQEIQRRKAQRRKERKLKKETAAEPKEIVAPPPPVDLGGLGALSGCQINICLPEGGKLDLMSLLSEADERVRRERRGETKSDAPAPSLNATTLRYLAEKVAPTSKLIEIEEI